MKCEACLSQLEEYVDGELDERDVEHLSAHLVTCAGCSRAFDGLTAEREIYTRYDRELEIPPSMWNVIEGRMSAEDRALAAKSRPNPRDWFAGFFARPRSGLTFAGAIAALVLALAIGAVYFRTQRQSGESKEIAKRHAADPNAGKKPVSPKDKPRPAADDAGPNAPSKKEPNKSPSDRNEKPYVRTPRQLIPREAIVKADQSDVFSEIASSGSEDPETEKYVERAQMLLRSIRNVEVSSDDDAVDVSYEKALSRRLLSENMVLRRDAELNGKFPVKALLSSLEPFLIDIANLQDQAKPDELRAIKDRLLKTEMVAALQSY